MTEGSPEVALSGWSQEAEPEGQDRWGGGKRGD